MECNPSLQKLTIKSEKRNTKQVKVSVPVPPWITVSLRGSFPFHVPGRALRMPLHPHACSPARKTRVPEASRLATQQDRLTSAGSNKKKDITLTFHMLYVFSTGPFDSVSQRHWSAVGCGHRPPESESHSGSFFSQS